MAFASYPGYEIENFEDENGRCYIRLTPESSRDTMEGVMRDPNCSAVQARQLARETGELPRVSEGESAELPRIILRYEAETPQRRNLVSRSTLALVLAAIALIIVLAVIF